MLSTRARFVATGGALATTGVLRYPAGAAEFSYKLALNFPLSYPPGARAAEACDKIMHDSGGRLEIKPFPNGMLGGNLQLLSQMRIGAIEFTLPPDIDLSNIVQVAGLTALPFIVSNRREGLDMLAGPLGAYIRAASEKVGIYQFPRSWDGGFLDVENALRPISKPSDIQGLKLRVPPGPIMVAMFKALGVTPNVLAASEMYTALQTHLIDGTAITLGVIEPFKLNEVMKYVSYTNHGWIGFSLLAGADAWQKLPANLRDLTSRHFEAARLASNDDMVKGDANVEQRLKSLGMSFNNVDSQAFRKAVRDSGLYSQWKASYPPDAWTLLEKSVGPLT